MIHSNRAHVRRIAFLLIFTATSSCASYRVVRVVRVTDPDTKASETYYGVSKNNILIPEFTLDARNAYPVTKEEAWTRFNARRQTIESLVNQKYKIPSSFLFQAERIVVGAGLILISPVAIPVQYLGGLSRDEEGKRSFSKTAHDYFDLSLNDIVTDNPPVADPLIQIPL